VTRVQNALDDVAGNVYVSPRPTSSAGSISMGPRPHQSKSSAQQGRAELMMMRVPCRGLHSFPFQLNFSSSVHRLTQLNP